MVCFLWKCRKSLPCHFYYEQSFRNCSTSLKFHHSKQKSFSIFAENITDWNFWTKLYLSWKSFFLLPNLRFLFSYFLSYYMVSMPGSLQKISELSMMTESLGMLTSVLIIERLFRLAADLRDIRCPIIFLISFGILRCGFREIIIIRFSDWFCLCSRRLWLL